MGFEQEHAVQEHQDGGPGHPPAICLETGLGFSFRQEVSHWHLQDHWI